MTSSSEAKIKYWSIKSWVVKGNCLKKIAAYCLGRKSIQSEDGDCDGDGW